MQNKESQKKSNELLLCPFCGAEARLQKKNRKRGWYVICKNRSCACSTPFYQNTFTSEENLKRVAIKVWNTRKPLEKISERLEERKYEHVNEYSKDFNLCEKSAYKSFEMAIEIVKEEGGMND